MRAELEPYHLDVQFDEGPPPADALERLTAIPGVEIVSEGASILAGPLGSEVGPFEGFGQGGLDERLGRDLERARLDEGRMPRRADEVLVSRRHANRLGLGIGDTLVLQTFTPAAIERVFAGEPASYDGPQVHLQIVGVGRQPEELTAGGDSPAPQFVVAPAFFEEWEGQVHWFDGIFLVRLRGGIEGVEELVPEIRAAFPGREDVAIHVSEEGARIDDAVSTQTTALALLAAVAILTGGLAIAQAAVRLARSAEADSRLLEALGLGKGQLVAARVGLVAIPIAVGVVAAGAIAVALSGLFPNGPAGRVEPNPGIRADVPVLLVGTLLLVAASGAATALLARPRSDHEVSRPSRVGDAVGRAIPSVAMTVGLQGALRRTSGAGSAPTRSASLALGAGVAGLVGSLVFGASLTRLVDEPARQGWNWDYEVALGDELTDDEALAQVRTVLDHRLSGALYGRTASKDLGPHSTVVVGIESLRGELHHTIVEGRPIQADGEIVLGRTTLDALGERVGGSIVIDGTDGPLELRIVGQGLFPTNENDDPAAGAAVTLATLERMSGSGGFPTLYVTVAPGVDVEALRADLEAEVGAVTGAVAPPVVSNLELVDQAPYLLAGYLVLLGIAASAHAIVMVIRQRRGELATLRAIGFDRRQVTTTVLAHSVTVAAIGAAVGLPIGLVIGRVAWRLVAGSLGFATDPDNPLVVMFAPGPGAVLLAVLIALGPAVWASRQSPGVVLRTE